MMLNKRAAQKTTYEKNKEKKIMHLLCQDYEPINFISISLKEMLSKIVAYISKHTLG